MKPKLAEILRSRGVKPSAQRLAIYENLVDRRDHPTADEVWAALAPAIPTLSRTTVYTSLRLLCDSGLARLIIGGGDSMRFDADTKPHSHFRCVECGAVSDIAGAPPCAETFALPRGTKTFAVDMFVSGICPACAKSGK